MEFNPWTRVWLYSCEGKAGFFVLIQDSKRNEASFFTVMHLES